MNIVTIFDYNLENINYKTMLYMFVRSIDQSCKKYPYTLWIITNQTNTIDRMFGNTHLRSIKPQYNPSIVPQSMPNIKNKLYNLCHLDFEFIYLDCDMYINEDLSFLWDKRKDRPFIATIHQKNINGHTTDNNAFLNSGLQIVSDPHFLNYDHLYEYAQSIDFKFSSPGTDQALLDSYCKQIGYDFTHPNIGCEWNSCAGYGLVDIDDEYNFRIRYKNKDIEYPVKINHYWNEFKPWAINCPIFKFYKELLA